MAHNRRETDCRESFTQTFKIANCVVVDIFAWVWGRINKRIVLKQDTQWSVKTPALSGDNTSVTLVCSGALVITRSRMLLPRVGVWLIYVKKWSCNASINGSSLAPEALSTESQEMFGKLMSPQITIFWNWSQTWSRKMLNKYTQLGSESGGLSQEKNNNVIFGSNLVENNCECCDLCRY